MSDVAYPALNIEKSWAKKALSLKIPFLAFLSLGTIIGIHSRRNTW